MTDRSISTALEDLINYSESTGYDDFPSETLSWAKTVLADTVGAIVAGASARELSVLARGSENGAASLLGTALRSSPEEAALFNGSAGTWIELDEGHYGSGGHPGIHVIPAALAVAEAQRSSGRELLRAIILGYEIAARVGAATSLRPEVHPHGTWGICGGAFAAGMLMRLDSAELMSALSMASTLAISSSRRAPLTGGTIRNLYAGIANFNAIVAARLARSGLTPGTDDVQRTFGKVLGNRFDPVCLVEGLGDAWAIEANFMKIHACCRDTQGAIEAVKLALPNHEWSEGCWEPIVHIHLRVPDGSQDMDNNRPVNSIAAKFSIPFVVATWLFHGHARPDAFSYEAVNNPIIKEIASRVRMETTPPDVPSRLRYTDVEIGLHDGGTLEGAVERYPGDQDARFAADVLENKFTALTESVFGRDGATNAWANLHRIDHATDMSTFLLTLVSNTRR